MDQQTLTFSGSGMPARIAGAVIFVLILIAYIITHFPIFILIIFAVICAALVLFSADITVTADKSARTLVVTKKRILMGSVTSYSIDDIVSITRRTVRRKDTQGKEVANTEFTLALKSKTSPTSAGGYLPVRLPIPTSGFTLLNSMLHDVQELERAGQLAAFLGVPLYERGGPNDMLVNAGQMAATFARNAQAKSDGSVGANGPEDELAAQEAGEIRDQGGTPPTV